MVVGWIAGTVLLPGFRPACGQVCIPPDAAAVRAWLAVNAIRVLNVAGPRESKRPGIYEGVRGFLEGVLRGLAKGQDR